MGSYAAVRAVAGYLPPTVEQNDVSDRLAREIGIHERHVVTTESAGDLAVSAGEALFRQYAVERTDIDFVLLCTQQPDYIMPTTACLVSEQLGLSHHCGALDYNLGCSGYVYGLALAKGLIESGMASNLLLLTSCLYSTAVDAKDSTTQPIFGDASTATLVSAVESDVPLLDAFAFGTDGSGKKHLMIPAGGSRAPFHQTPETFATDSHGNMRSNYEIFMDGQEVMLFTLREVPVLVEQVLALKGINREQLDYCVFHQANQFMLKYVQKKCRLKDVPFYNDVTRTGNTVSSSVPLGIEAVLQQRSAAELRRVMLAGFGVGLSWAGCMADLGQVLEKKQN